MGINASYLQIQNKPEISSDEISGSIIEILSEKCKFIVKERLTYESWLSNKKLFCIAVTPFGCFELGGSIGNEIEKNWTLITESYYAIELNGWELPLSGALNTKIERYGVYDTSNTYTFARFSDNKILEEKESEETCYTIIQYFVPDSFYSLSGYPGRINNIGEQFLTFESNEQTFFINPNRENKFEADSSHDEDIIPF